MGALRTKPAQVNKTVESRGTFSPIQRSRTVTFTVTQVRDSDISDPAVPQHEVACSAPQHAVVSSDVPLHAEAISVKDPKHPADSSDVPQQKVVSSSENVSRTIRPPPPPVPVRSQYRSN